MDPPTQLHKIVKTKNENNPWPGRGLKFPCFLLIFAISPCSLDRFCVFPCSLEPLHGPHECYILVRFLDTYVLCCLMHITIYQLVYIFAYFYFLAKGILIKEI